MKAKASLAPMAGYTDSPFRRICGECGAEYAVSEMISAAALHMRDRKTAELAKIGEGEPPVILQIFGHDPRIMAEAAELLLTGSYPGCSYAAAPAGIDINMGCPVKKIVTGGDGCALMLDLPMAERIAAEVREVCVRHGVPLSVKFRLGWDSLTAPEFACAMARAGADRITLHCRTREQMYRPYADLDAAAAVSRALAESADCSARSTRPVLVGNGDVDSPEAARRYLDSGCDEVAVGRAALGYPWIFRRLKDPDGFVPPDWDEIRAAMLRLTEEAVREKGELRGIRESRGRAAYFVRGMRGAASLRDKLNRAGTFSEFAALLNGFEADGTEAERETEETE